MSQKAVKVSAEIVIPKGDPKTQGGHSMPQMLLPIFTGNVTLINQLIGFAKRDGRVYYFNGQMPIFVHDEGDLNSFKMFMAQLFVTGNATQSEINRPKSQISP